MKTIHQLLAATALLAGSFLAADASAQCYSFPAAPAISRFYRFQLDGRPFAFDRMTGDIFCNNIKIGVRTPDGQVSLLPGAGAQFGAAPVAGVPGQPVVAPAGGAVAGVAPVGGAAGPAVGGAVGAPAGGAVGGAVPPQGGAAPIQGGVAPVQGAAPVQGGVAPAQGGVAPAQGAAPVQNGIPAQGAAPGQAVPPAAGATPATLGPTATAGTPAAGGAIPVLGSGNDPALAAIPAIDPQLLAGQWRAETKDIFGETKISELNFEDAKNLSLRIQTQGNEPRLVEGAFEIAKDGNLTVKQDDENKDLGLISADNGQLVLKNGNEVFTFKKVEE